MKKLLALSIAASLFTFAASAQTDRAISKAEKQERHQGKHKGQLKKELNLSDDQGQKLKAINAEMKAKKEALKAQDNLTVKEMKERKAALKAEKRERMSAILTPEQKAKFQEMKKHKMGERGNRKGRGRGKG